MERVEYLHAELRSYPHPPAQTRALLNPSSSHPRYLLSPSVVL